VSGLFFEIAFNVFGGLGLFLFGMRQMSSGLQAIAGESLRRIINLLTVNRFVAVLVGFAITAVIQSSSVTTVMVVGFVNAGLMNIVQAIGLIMGANIGTTVTGWIIAIKITKYALPMIAIGVFMYLFIRRESVQLWGQALYGLGMVFFGLVLMKDGFSPLKESEMMLGLLQRFGAATFGQMLLTLLVGTAVTMLIQSSSAFIGIIMAMACTGLITFPSSVVMILAANIGTTITAQIASIGTNVHARRAARAHFIFNILGVLMALVVFRQFVQLVDWLVPHSPDTLSGDTKPYIMQHIAMATTIFNVVTVVLLVPFIRPLATLVTWLVPQRGKDEKHLTFVDDRLLGTPSLAVEQARQEVLTMSNMVREMLEKGINLFLLEKGRTTAAREIFAMENQVDNFQRDLTVFLSKLLQASLTSEEGQETRALVRITDEIESIGDYAENLAKCYMRTKKNEVDFTETAKNDIARMGRHILDYFDFNVEALKKDDRTKLAEAKSKGDTINHIADEIRDDHIKRFDDNICDPRASLIYSDIIVAMRRIKNHTFNIAEAVAKPT